MANSMDPILVSFGVSLTKEEQRLVLFASSLTGEEKQRAEKLKKQIKTMTVPEFIYPERYPDNPPLNLTETEGKIQHAIRQLYELNEKDPPLYQEFPTFRSDKNPLTIDLTTAGMTGEDAEASFKMETNKVEFEETDKPDVLVATLAHELKHAEQCGEEAYRLHIPMNISLLTGKPMENAYAWHQLHFLMEAQACVTGVRAYHELFGTTPNMPLANIYEKISSLYTDASGRKDEKKIEKMAIPIFLNMLYKSSYKDNYDMFAPLGENDAGLDHIPESFHLPQSLLTNLNEAPRTSKFGKDRKSLLQPLIPNSSVQRRSNIPPENSKIRSKSQFDRKLPISTFSKDKSEQTSTEQERVLDLSSLKMDISKTLATAFSEAYAVDFAKRAYQPSDESKKAYMQRSIGYFKLIENMIQKGQQPDSWYVPSVEAGVREYDRLKKDGIIDEEGHIVNVKKLLESPLIQNTPETLRYAWMGPVKLADAPIIQKMIKDQNPNGGQGPNLALLKAGGKSL